MPPASEMAPGCALLRATTHAMTNTTVSTGNAYRSKACTRLWPKNAITICAMTTMTRHSAFGIPLNSALSANAPLTLFTANQPIPATSELMPAGRMLPRNPKPLRLITIWTSPCCGPHDDSTPCEMDPRALPSTIASTDCQNPSPKYSGPRMPTPTVANSMFGEVHVHSSWLGRPWRSSNGMNSTPPGSTATTRSP